MSPNGPFTAKEADYLTEQIYGRIATVGKDGSVHNVPVAFHFNAELGAIEITGRNLGRSRKYRDAVRYPQVAFVVDDVPSREPEIVRGIEIRGIAETLAIGGKAINAHCADELIRVHPRRIISWGVNAGLEAGFDSRDVNVDKEEVPA